MLINAYLLWENMGEENQNGATLTHIGLTRVRGGIETWFGGQNCRDQIFEIIPSEVQSWRKPAIPFSLIQLLSISHTASENPMILSIVFLSDQQGHLFFFSSRSIGSITQNIDPEG